MDYPTSSTATNMERRRRKFPVQVLVNASAERHRMGGHGDYMENPTEKQEIRGKRNAGRKRE